MAQNPFKVDQLQIEPGTSGTRLIRRAVDGSLEFVDPSNVAGVTLGTLAAAGTTALSEAIKSESVAFSAELTKAVAFTTAYSDALYSVSLELDSDPESAWWITSKSAFGFTINFAVPVTLNVRWTTIRLG